MMLVQPLTGSHDRQGFDCGRAELTHWLRQVARQHQDKGLSKTYVAIQENALERICGFYALTLAELDSTHLPSDWCKKLPRRIPGVRLGRLAVDVEYQGKKLGELLLIDALTRSRRIYQEAGGIGLFVDAIDSHAAGFYRRFGFESSPDQPLLLFLPAHLLMLPTNG
jgi:ribosomal protein S18 acetylase RimI-like enzyme